MAISLASALLASALTAGVHEGTGGAPINRTNFGPITRENSREAIKILGGLGPR